MTYPTILTISLAAWVLIPTGTPDDIIPLAIIAHVGLPTYLIFLAVLFLLMWHYKISFVKIYRTLRRLFKRRVFK